MPMAGVRGAADGGGGQASSAHLARLDAGEEGACGLDAVVGWLLQRRAHDVGLEDNVVAGAARLDLDVRVGRVLTCVRARHVQISSCTDAVEGATCEG